MDDAGPLCTQRYNWSKAYLIEPMANTFATLERLYDARKAEYQQAARSGSSSSHVVLRRAAVCGASCSADSLPFWRVNLENTTNFASAFDATSESDGRCATITGEGGFLSEISSLDRRHVAKHSHIFRHLPDACEKCGQALWHRPLPPTCMRRVIVDNLAVENVACLCLGELLKAEASVTLLLIDAEGRDAEVLLQYPFERLPPQRVAFEPMHLSNDAWDRAVTLLKSHGYENVMGARQSAWQSVWHRVKSRAGQRT